MDRRCDRNPPLLIEVKAAASAVLFDPSGASKDAMTIVRAR
jgi:hypothetical protein